jgi:hypothetical protein
MAKDSQGVQTSLNIKPRTGGDLSQTGDFGADATDSNRLKFNRGTGAQRVLLQEDATTASFTTAANVTYDHSTSGLSATNAQSALDQIDANVDTNTANLATNTANISTNTASIATNTTNIAANTANIVTNTTNIASNTASIVALTSSITDSTTTGSLATLQSADVTKAVVRLTNASLVSVAGIPAGTSGKVITIENQTGAVFSINNQDASASSGNRIFTGTGGSINLAANASLTLLYDSVVNSWMVIGGTGGGQNSFQSIVTSGSTTTLTSASPVQTLFTGSAIQTCTLPVVSTLVAGQQYIVSNLSGFPVTVKSSGGNTLQVLSQNDQVLCTCISTSGTGTASWIWTDAVMDAMALPIANGGTGQTTKTAAFDTLSPVTAIGDLIYGGPTLHNVRLPAGTNGNVLQTTGGVPTWSALGLATANAVSGQLPIANGGTGVAALPTTPTVSAFAAWDANKNLAANNLIESFATTVTAAGTTVLTVASAYIQQFTGTTTQIVTLPVVATLTVGQAFSINNRSTGAVTVNSSGGNVVQIVSANTQAIITCSAITGTTAASWDVAYSSSSGGGVLAIANGGTGVSALPTTATASAFAAWDVNKNLSLNNLLEGFTTTATAAGTTALTVSSTYIQQFTGTQIQTITLPATSTMAVGQGFTINNRSTKALTVNTSTGSFVQTINAGGQAIINCTLASGNTATSWDSAYSIRPGWTTSTVASGSVPVPYSLLEHVVFTNGSQIDFTSTGAMSGAGSDGQIVRIWGPNNTSGSIVIGNVSGTSGQTVNGQVVIGQYQMIELTYLSAYNTWIESDRNF